MATVRSSVLSFLRRNPRSWKHPIPRHLCVEGQDREDEAELNGKNRQVTSESSREWLDIVTKVCNITRTRSRWEETLLSDFPSFDFSDPCFFRELLRQQGNVLHSLRFFYWLRTRDGFVPDPDSCNRLFDALVEANALRVAKGFLEEAGLSPSLPSLERYLISLCEEGGLSGDAIEMVYVVKGSGHFMSIQAWKSVLLCCLNGKRTDLLWEFFHDMIDSNVSREMMDVEIIEILIRAFCNDGRVSEGYDLLLGILKDGVVPGRFCFNKLIAGFCKLKNFGKVSEIIHLMIQRGVNPDIYTYQEVVNGLCKNRKIRKAYHVFNDLKDRGYAPDTVMYTAMIHGLCKIGWLGDAKKLWFEMIKKGLVPNEYTYISFLHGLYRVHDLEGAARLYKEICDRGYGETTVLYNTVIAGLCSHGIIDEAYRLFQEMPQKGIVRDAITFNALIRGLCKGGRIVEGINLLKELLDGGIQPSTSSYTPIIENLCLSGGVQEARNFLSEMQSRGLEPKLYTHHHIITGLCKEGYIKESMEHLVEMLKSKLKPQENTFEELMHCLLQCGRLDDSLITLKHMFGEGYSLETGLSHFLVTKFCGENSNFAELCLEGILENT